MCMSKQGWLILINWNIYFTVYCLLQYITTLFKLFQLNLWKVLIYICGHVCFFCLFSEVAFGFKGLQIQLYYSAGNLSTLFKVKYSSKVTESFDCVEVGVSQSASVFFLSFKRDASVPLRCLWLTVDDVFAVRIESFKSAFLWCESVFLSTWTRLLMSSLGGS